MKTFLKSAGIPAVFALGAALSAQAAEQPAAAETTAPAAPAPAARFALTAYDTDTSKAIGFALNKHIDLTVEGYAAATAAFTKQDHKRANGLLYNATGKDFHGGRDYSLFDSKKSNLDATFLGLNAANKMTGLSAYASVLWVPDGRSRSLSNEAGILDAYIQWQKVTNGGTITLTGGKYLSFFGLESFYAPNMNQLTYGLQSFLPGYHTGIKGEFKSKDGKIHAGLSIEDSLYSDYGDNHFCQGDGKLSGIGIEAMLGIQFSKEFSLKGIIGFDSKPESRDGGRYDFVFDLIATYAINLRNGGKLTFEGELTYENKKNKNAGDWLLDVYPWLEDEEDFELPDSYPLGTRNNEQAGWALVARYTQETGRLAGFSALARLSGNYKHYHNGVDTAAHSFTLSPGYAFNKHFLVRAEFTWQHGTDFYWVNLAKNQYFFGIQSVFSF